MRTVSGLTVIAIALTTGASQPSGGAAGASGRRDVLRLELPISVSPVACTPQRLDAAQFERRRRLMAELLGRVTHRAPVAGGLRLRFEADEDTAGKLVRWIMLERRCCPFMTFALEARPDDGPLWLTIAGPEGTAAFLESAMAELENAP